MQGEPEAWSDLQRFTAKCYWLHRDVWEVSRQILMIFQWLPENVFYCRLSLSLFCDQLQGFRVRRTFHRSQGHIFVIISCRIPSMKPFRNGVGNVASLNTSSLHRWTSFTATRGKALCLWGQIWLVLMTMCRKNTKWIAEEDANYWNGCKHETNQMCFFTSLLLSL